MRIEGPDQGGGIVSRRQGVRLDNEGRVTGIMSGKIFRERRHSLALKHERQFKT